MSVFSLFNGLDSIIDSIITPPRQEYSTEDLGANERCVNKKVINRKDLKIRNRRGYTIECSHFMPVEYKTKLPCVVYLHANGCSRLEALPYVDAICRNEMTLFCFDFSGSGLSQGPFSSLGWYEQEDLESVIHHLCTSGRVNRIALWGRSMGAITSLLYSRRDYRITCMVVDSPFASFKQLVQELAKKRVSFPSFLALAGFSILRKAILKRAGFDIELLEPINHVDKIRIPAMFAAGDEDTFVSPDHTKQLHKLYKGVKQIILFEGEHNSQRPLSFIFKAAEFILEHLKGENEPLPEALIMNKLDEKKSAKKLLESRSHTSTQNSTTKEEKKTLRFNRCRVQPSVPEKPKVESSAKMPDQKVSKPKLQFSWLEHSSSTPSLSINTAPKTMVSGPDQVGPNFKGISLKLSQIDSIGSENSPCLPNFTTQPRIHPQEAQKLESKAQIKKTEAGAESPVVPRNKESSFASTYKKPQSQEPKSPQVGTYARYPVKHTTINISSTLKETKNNFSTTSYRPLSLSPEEGRKLQQTIRYPQTDPQQQCSSLEADKSVNMLALEKDQHGPSYADYRARSNSDNDACTNIKAPIITSSKPPKYNYAPQSPQYHNIEHILDTLTATLKPYSSPKNELKENSMSHHTGTSSNDNNIKNVPTADTNIQSESPSNVITTPFSISANPTPPRIYLPASPRDSGANLMDSPSPRNTKDQPISSATTGNTPTSITSKYTPGSKYQSYYTPKSGSYTPNNYSSTLKDDKQQYKGTMHQKHESLVDMTGYCSYTERIAQISKNETNINYSMEMSVKSYERTYSYYKKASVKE